jgi:hypothetical protein
MDVWHGSVMDGITLRACIVLDPCSRREFKVGQFAVLIASGRTPSSMIKTTGGMVYSSTFLLGSCDVCVGHILCST